MATDADKHMEAVKEAIRASLVTGAKLQGMYRPLQRNCQNCGAPLNPHSSLCAYCKTTS
jgi:hypothetical protein